MHWHGPTGFDVQRGKRGGLVGKGKGPCQRNDVSIKKKLEHFLSFIYNSCH